ncbi:MAG: hypothetical protein ACRD19_15060 [Terriglobia bacterium]
MAAAKPKAGAKRTTRAGRTGRATGRSKPAAKQLTRATAKTATGPMSKSKTAMGLKTKPKTRGAGS